MFRSILIPTAVLLSLTTLFAQQEMPAELALKLNDKAEKLFPNNAKAQDKWLNEQNENYALLPMLAAPAGNEEIFNKHILPLAEKKFDLDFTSKAKFIQDMSEGLMTIDAYKNVFGENAALFNKMKADVLKSNPEDFKKAAKQFEEQSQMMIEIDSLPRNSLVDDELFYGLKAAANKKFPGDFAKQKAYLENILNVFTQYEVLASNAENKPSASRRQGKAETSQSQMQNNYQETLMNSQMFVRGENGDGIGIITEIKGKPVVIFPSALYDANGVSIVNNLDEPAAYSDILIGKDSPYAVAILKKLPDGMKAIPMASTEQLKNEIQKPAYIFVIQDNSFSLRRNQILSLKQNSLNLSGRLPRGMTQGAGLFKFDENGNPQILGISVKENAESLIPDLSNKAQARDFERVSQNRKSNIGVSRIDEISGWQKIDNAKFAEDAALLKKISDNNKSFLAFFIANNLNDLASIEIFGDITEKYLKIFKEQRQDENSLNKNVKNMISETSNLMGKDIRKIDVAEINPILRGDFEFQLKLRNAMIESLKTALKKNQIKRFIFDDIQLRR
ncbi:MAG: hypothetical protein J6R08_01250 [Opitutales bacterium]|nr:hypothetical protein [Opitutales bacterium]